MRVAAGLAWCIKGVGKGGGGRRHACYHWSGRRSWHVSMHVRAHWRGGGGGCRLLHGHGGGSGIQAGAQRAWHGMKIGMRAVCSNCLNVLHHQSPHLLHLRV
eukprot:364983-Chlamydomonas_euryale.AAC.5